MSLNKPIKPVKIMEICGTHTMSIAQNGIRSLLPEDIELISGPGCPVCVSPSSVIDIALDLIQDPNVFLFSYGDMLRIPSTDQKHLLGNKNVKMCLTPMDALNFAKKYPDKKIIFLGVGFETTAPGSAVAILEASRQNIQNFFFWSLLKQTKPAIKTLIEAKGSSIDGFICPGHVACIIGEKGFTFLCDDTGDMTQDLNQKIFFIPLTY